MSFLSPLFLIGLLAGLIPIAIHFIRREKPVKVPFSTLRFFENTSRKHFLFQRLQQWLLLLLRTVVVVLLAVSFARPFFSQSLSSLVDMAPRSQVILIDHSMSMSYPNYLDRAKREATQRLNDLRPGDEAAVIFFAETATQTRAFTSDINALNQFVDSLERAEPQTTRFFPALRAADELLKESKFDDKSVVLISDFQTEGMVGFEVQWKLQPGVDFFTVDVAEAETRNMAITGVKLPAQIRGEVGEQTLNARLRSFGTLLEDSASLVLTVDGEEQSRQSVDLNGQSERVITLPISLSEEGSHSGYIRIEGDEFTADDEYYFTVDVLPKINVLVVNGESSNNWYDDEGHWFELAAQSNDQSPFAVESVQADQWRPGGSFFQNGLPPEVVVLLNVGRLDNSQAQGLLNYVRTGGKLLIAPGDRVDGREFNRQLETISPGTLVAINELRRDDYLVIADMALRHPILQPLDLDWNVRFEGNWQVEPGEQAEVIMSFDNGMPALLERQIENGRVLLFSSSLDLEWNNLPLQGIYLPFVHEMLKYLAQSQQKQSSYSVGEHITINSGLSELTDPQGNSVSLPEGASFTLAAPGVYQALVNNQAILYAANVPTAESALSRMSPGDLLDQILNPETKPTQSREVRAQLLGEEIEKPQRLWWWLLLFVALLLVAESFVSNRTHR